MTMRRPQAQSLVLAALAATLVGCGSGADTASDGGSGRPSDRSSASSGVLDFDQVALVSQTAAGGRVSAEPVRLDRPRAVHRFTGQFRGDALAVKVAAEVRRADVPDDRTLLGAVVAVGCDVPPGVRVEDSAAGPQVTALPVEAPQQECFAPVTTVALVSVPASAL